MKKRRKERLSFFISSAIVICIITMGGVLFVVLFPDSFRALTKNRGAMVLIYIILGLISFAMPAVPLFLKRNRKRLTRFSFSNDYEAAIVRVKPGFDTDNVFRSFVVGGVFGVLFVGSGYLVVGSILGQVRGLFDIWFLSLVIPSVLFLGWASYSAVKKGIVTLFQRQRWFSEARKVDAVIVDKQVEEVAQKDGKITFRYELILKIGGQLFRTAVNEAIFRRYVNLESVDLFYLAGSPEVFVIDGE